MPLPAGTRLGPYAITGMLGVGGMGEVYRARDTRLKRDIAIKVLPGAWAHDGDRLARFQREAEVLATLNHPNIAAIYGFEETDHVRALLLELVEGPTLAEHLKQGSLPVGEAAAIARQIAEALDAAHERGIVHRDLKPANIKVRADGVVKVLDFGLAKALEPETASSSDTTASTMTSPAMTEAGVILGTAAYMSPEQARGQAIDRRTDVWAFGCVLYEMLTGRAPFGGDTVMDSLTAILHRDPDWIALPASVPPGLRHLVRRCLQKDRKARLRDIGDVHDQLDDVEPDLVASTVTPVSGRRTAGSSLLALLGAGAALVAIGAAAAIWWGAGPAAFPSATAARFIRITSDDSLSMEPAVSRDGSLVVYASDRAGNGQLDLWLQRTSGGPALPLTNDPADDRAPSFSPDGSVIAFRSNRGGGGVYVMPALGGDARLVAEGGHDPQFSPDGSHSAYWRGPWLGGFRGDGFSVFVMTVNGGQQRRIADGFVTANQPIWSPSGRSLLFFGRRTAETPFDWWLASIEGGEPTPTGAYPLFAGAGLASMATTGELSDAFPEEWTTAGVQFSASSGDGANLWRVGIAERTGRVVETSLRRVTNGVGSDLSPASDEIGRVVFQVSADTAVSLTLPLDPNAARVTGDIVRQSSGAGSWRGTRNSLDNAGRRLAYVKSRPAEHELWVKDLVAGQERHVVTTPRVPTLNPVISPDGLSVAYTLPDGASSAGFVVSASGGTPKKICGACVLQGWFGDSRRILSIDRMSDGPGSVVTVIDAHDPDVDGRSRKTLVVDPHARIGRTDVSPDGRWLVFSGPSGTLWNVPVRPGNPPAESEWVKVLTRTPGSGERACGWSPDGRLLYMLLERDDFRDLYAERIDPTTGRPVADPFVVRHLHDPRRRWGSTPFGTAIVSNAFVFNQVEMIGSIWLMDTAPQATR